MTCIQGAAQIFEVYFTVLLISFPNPNKNQNDKYDNGNLNYKSNQRPNPIERIHHIPTIFAHHYNSLTFWMLTYKKTRFRLRVFNHFPLILTALGSSTPSTPFAHCCN
ncbi:protein of unknown function [Oenococcus oeni]|uniref:Uncharacterized protein n=1 Tax=Oenococcus oeni TaxID=1247 RepID=A0AAQ2ZDS3_OENOE|nr:hypothetical protein OENI_550006 [Oenococcus oeni]VDB97053.1 protein of unknown function [Oenococcus oeni]